MTPIAPFKRSRNDGAKELGTLGFDPTKKFKVDYKQEANDKSSDNDHTDEKEKNNPVDESVLEGMNMGNMFSMMDPTISQ